LIPLSHTLTLSFILFGIGLAGIFTRKDAITIFLSVEIILNAANVAFIGFSQSWGDEFGHIATFIVIAVAAAEAAIGLSIVIRLSQQRESLRVDSFKELKG
jgi:NADH-quinone oxidoreductase subunit K